MNNWWNKVTANHVIAVLLILPAWGLLYLIVMRGIGGPEAVFAILGYVAGWISAVVLFFFRKAPKPKTVEPPKPPVPPVP